jgi:hypothetical protein
MICGLHLLYYKQDYIGMMLSRRNKITIQIQCTLIVFCCLYFCSFAFHNHRHTYQRHHYPSLPTTRIQPSTTSLFGIKGFRAWFEGQFPNATFEISPSSKETFDHVFVDMNQVLHVIMRRSRSKEHSIRLLMSELDSIMGLTTPTKSLVLAIDGPPAAAKLATQRRRRYGTLVRTNWKLTHFDKLRISKRHRSKRLRGYKSDLKSLEITPATEFMKCMEASLIYWAWQRLQQRYSILNKVKVYISPSTVPGEGEVKLLEWILHQHPSTSIQPRDSLCFIGGDSDLLLEGLVIPPSLCKNVFVVRQEKAHRHLCISLWETTRSLATDTLKTKELTSKQILQVRADLVLLMILNGNDYLPKLRGSRGFSNIFDTYTAVLKEFPHSGLVHPDTLDLNLDFCQAFFQRMVSTSPVDLWTNTAATTTSERRTPLGELNNIMDGGFLPKRLRFHVLNNNNKNDSNDIEDDDDDEEDDIHDDNDDEEDFDEEEEYDMTPEMEKVGTEKEDGEGEILVRMTLGHPNSNDYLVYETWHNVDEPLKVAKQKLASMALDEFLGTDYSGDPDSFDVDAGITNSGYSWEIRQAIDGKVDQYLAGLVWCLQTYQDGICADYGFNYGRRMSPTAMEIVDFLQIAQEQKQTIGKRSLLGDAAFRTPISAGLACLAALPSQVKHLVPMPYRNLPDDLVETYYEKCMDPKNNVFDVKSFEKLCEDKILSFPSIDDDEKGDEHHGRRILTGDHYWTVLGKTREPLPHPFDPPTPPCPELNELYGVYICCIVHIFDIVLHILNLGVPFTHRFATENHFIRVTRLLATSAPRPRSVWGEYESSSNVRRHQHNNKNSISDEKKLHSEIGDSFPTESILDVPYKIAFPEEYRQHTNKQQQQYLKRKHHTDNVKPADSSEAISIRKRRKKFKMIMLSKTITKNVDQQTALDILKALEDIGMIGPSKFSFTTPSGSEFASFNPEEYEYTKLVISASSQKSNNILKQAIEVSQDRDLKKQSRKPLKHHLASLSLQDMTGPKLDWTKCTYGELKQHLMQQAGLTSIVTLKNNKDSSKRASSGKIALTTRLEEFKLVMPSEDLQMNKDGDTAVQCINQLRDTGLIGKTIFRMTSPSKSKYASIDPPNYENIRLSIKKAKTKKVLGVLREDLHYSQDRDVNKQTRRALKQHLASLALCDITGPQRRWSEMTSAELKEFLKEKNTNTKYLPPLEEV